VQRERSLAELRANLGATRFDHATRRGKCMAPHDGIAYALTSDVAESSAGR
jgi:hypothetical protein